MLCDLNTLWSSLCTLIDLGAMTLLQAVAVVAKWCNGLVA